MSQTSATKISYFWLVGEKNGGSYNQHQIWNAKRFEIFFSSCFGVRTVLNLLAWKPDKYQTTTKIFFENPFFSLFFSESEFLRSFEQSWFFPSPSFFCVSAEIWTGSSWARDPGLLFLLEDVTEYFITYKRRAWSRLWTGFCSPRILAFSFLAINLWTWIQMSSF